MEPYPAPKRGRCKKGFKKNKTTKMCDPITEENIEIDKIKKKLQAYLAPKRGPCKKGYKKNKTTKMCEPKEENEIKDISNNPTMKDGRKEQFIKLLKEFETLMKNTGEVFRARAYNKASTALENYSEDIHKVEDLNDIPNIGKTIKEKFKEFLDTGKINALEVLRNNPVNLFTNVYGIGPKKAKELVSKGITTIAQLKEHKEELNDKQLLGLKYYEDILKRIPREEIIEYETIVKNEFDFEDSQFEIVGSFRRGASSSGDIDIILTNKNNDSSILNKFINKLEEKNIIKAILASGSKKKLVIGQLPGKPARRLDFLYTPPNEYPFAILYFTGSAAFNQAMRHHALTMNLTLNEHGFHEMVKKNKGNALDKEFSSEKDIFTYLNMEYKEPKDRINHTSVVNKVDVSSPPKLTIKKQKTLKKKQKASIEELLSDFKNNGISVLDKLSKTNLSDMIKVANHQYYNHADVTILTDNQYDILKEFIEKKYPTIKVLSDIGAPVEHKKVKLPYEMWSMDKIKPDTKALDKWLKKYDEPKKYVLSAKLDGVSGLYIVSSERKVLYTRGNGKIGQDISHLIPLINLPVITETDEPIVIRGEFIIKRKVFETKFKEFANPRNLVAGLINKIKSIDENKMKYIDFIAYELINPEMEPSEQYRYFELNNIVSAKHELVNKLTNDMLSEKLVDWRENYEYEIDGIIITHDKIYKRESKNPEHAFAFKMVLSDQVAEAKVVNVLWSASKDGFLKPRIQIEPIKLGGTTIEYATAFNAAFVEKNKLGIGSLIKIIRSGDVIPYITEVIQPAENPKMPDVDYKWNDTHVDIILVDSDKHPEVKFKKILKFFTDLDVSGLGPGNVKKLIEAGFDSIAKILAASKDDFLKMNGFKEKSANKLWINIHNKIDKVTLPELMKATNLFGRGIGERKIGPILQEFPNIITDVETRDQKINKLLSIKGFAKKTAEKFVDGIDDFKDFIDTAGLGDKLKEYKPPEIKDGTLTDIKVIFTGFRDKMLQEKIKIEGGKIASQVNKDTNYVIVSDKNPEPNTDKYEKGKKLNIIILESKFKELFNLY